MSLLDEYGNLREAKGRREGRMEGFRDLLLCLVNSGDCLSDISKKTGKSVEELEDILATD